MVEPTKHEVEAIMAAGGPAGAYIEELGQTDMAKWTEEQWFGFLEVVCLSFCEKLGRLVASGDVPF